MDEPVSRPSGVFAATRWTLVLRARAQTPEARTALGELCEAYWTPVFRFLVREGRSEDAARELTQDFFARLLARGGVAGVEPGRGRFRSFLLGAVKHFLADRRDRERRLKRGGGHAPEPLEQEGGTSAGLQVPALEGLPPDAYFDREWARALVDRAVTRLALEMREAAKADQFTRLKPWLLGEVSGVSHADIAREMGSSEGAVKVAIHRLRQRFREVVKEEIAQTVNDPAEVRAELRYLVEVLAQAGADPAR